MPDTAQPFATSHMLGVHEYVVANAHVELLRVIADIEAAPSPLRSRLVRIAEALHPEAIRKLVDETWATSPYAKRAPRSGVLVHLHGGREG